MSPDNAINGFENSATDFTKHYLLTRLLNLHERFKMRFLYDFRADKIGGASVMHPDMLKPFDNGTIVYLNCYLACKMF